MKHHIIVMILGLGALEASAADQNWYFGAGGGIAEVHGGYDQVVPANFPAVTQSDATGQNTVQIFSQINPHDGVVESGAIVHQSTRNPVASWNLAAGYRFSPYLAVEADYEQPSTVNSLTILSSPSIEELVRNQTSHSDLGLSLIGFYPISSRFRLFGGAGLGWSWERVRTTDEILSASPNALVEPDTTRQFLRAQLRAGAELSVTSLLSLRVGWDRPDANLRNWRGYNSVQELSIDNFSATALWAF
jgi:hypothetical protein